MAAHGRDITRVLIIFMFISMALLLQLAQSSRTRFLLGQAEAEETETMKKEKEVMKRVGYGGSAVEVEGRQVPTGPDPLHHNNSPNTTP